MVIERWRQIESLLHAAHEKTGEERTRFLDEACSTDPTLRHEVESLLANEDLAAGFLESDGSVARAPAVHEPVAPACIGGFAIAMLHGLPRPTVDVDCLAVIPPGETARLQSLAGEGSALHKKCGVYVQHVGIARPRVVETGTEFGSRSGGRQVSRSRSPARSRGPGKPVPFGASTVPCQSGAARPDPPPLA
ncbi:MAG: hypothetical protein HY235_17515 [Acidobacteria bacterium]|nr:hypothetical protein [Acidobacteriota bacterium]